MDGYVKLYVDALKRCAEDDDKIEELINSIYEDGFQDGEEEKEQTK